MLTSTSDLAKRIDSIYANIGCFTKMSTNRFSDVFNNTFNYCEAVESKDVTLLSYLMPLVTKFAPNLIHKVLLYFH